MRFALYADDVNQALIIELGHESRFQMFHSEAIMV